MGSVEARGGGGEEKAGMLAGSGLWAQWEKGRVREGRAGGSWRLSRCREALIDLNEVGEELADTAGRAHTCAAGIANLFPVVWPAQDTTQPGQVTLQGCPFFM